jgi:enoyl-CoA hydratase
VIARERHSGDGGLRAGLACDVIFVARGARFLDTHARVGIVPGWGLSQRLPRLIGINRAKELSLSGNALTAERAYDWGLANRVCEPERLLDEAKALARDMCGCVPGVMEQVKRMIDTGYSMLRRRDGYGSRRDRSANNRQRRDRKRRASVMERGRSRVAPQK